MYFGSDEDVFESPLPLAGCASLRAASGRACVGSRRSRVVAPHVALPARFFARPPSLGSRRSEREERRRSDDTRAQRGAAREREGAFEHVLVTAEIH